MTLNSKAIRWTLLLGIALATVSSVKLRTAHSQPQHSAAGKKPGSNQEASDMPRGKGRDGAKRAKTKHAGKKKGHTKARRSMKVRKEHRAKNQQDRMQRRHDRLQAAAKKMRERAIDLRKRADENKSSKKSNRPGAVPLTPEVMRNKAAQLEKKAAELDKRATQAAEGENMGRHGVRKAHKRAGRLRASSKARRKFLRKRWGRKLKSKLARQELTSHARRIAKLKRIRSLAQLAKDHDTAKRATKLLVREQARHQKSMAALPTASAQSLTAPSQTPPPQASPKKPASKP